MVSIKLWSARVAFILLALLIFINSATFLGEARLDYNFPFVLIAGGLIFLTEVGVRRYTDISSIKAFGPLEIVSSVFGVLMLVIGFMTLPLIGLEVAWLTTGGGMLGMAISLVMMVQSFF